MKNGETIRVIDTRKKYFLAYQLYWELLIHWRVHLYDSTWFDHLSRLMRKQSVHVLNHLFAKPGRSRFEVSSQSDMASGRLAELLRSVLSDLIVSRTPSHLLGIITSTVWEISLVSRFNGMLPPNSRRLMVVMRNLRKAIASFRIFMLRRTYQDFGTYSM